MNFIDYEYIWETRESLHKNISSKKFILMNPEECWLFPERVDKLINAAEQGTDVTVFVNNIDPRYQGEKFQKIKFIEWPLHQLFRTACYVNDQQGNYNDIKYLFVSLNRRATENRKILIDVLHSGDIINYGKFSWHGADPVKTNYRSQFWDDSHQVILDHTEFSGRSYSTEMKQWFVPKEFYQSLVSVVGETTPSIPWLTEKTYMCIWLEKPFLIAGHRSSYEILKNLGFKLHNDIFDYSYLHLSENSTSQSMGIKDNLDRIKNENYQELRLAMEPVIKYNKQRMLELFHDDSSIPDMFKNHLRYIQANPDKSQGVDADFLSMLQHLDFLKNT